MTVTADFFVVSCKDSPAVPVASEPAAAGYDLAGSTEYGAGVQPPEPAPTTSRRAV